MPNECSLSPEESIRREALALFGKLLGEDLDRPSAREDLRRLQEILVNICSSGPEGPPTLTQEERGSMAEWSEPLPNGQLQ